MYAIILALALTGVCCPQSKLPEYYCKPAVSCCDKHTQVIHVSGLTLKVTPMDDGVKVEVESNKTLPSELNYQKLKDGGYKVSLVVRDRSVVKKIAISRK